MKIMNKRGAESGNTMMVLIFGFILFIIVGGVALSFAMFFGQPMDYRYSDASLLFTKTARCLTENQINDNFMSSFYANCGITESVVKDQRMVIKISSDVKTYVQIGDDVQCQLQDKNMAYSRCVFKDVSVNFDGKLVVFHIITGSNQEEISK